MHALVRTSVVVMGLLLAGGLAAAAPGPSRAVKVVSFDTLAVAATNAAIASAAAAGEAWTHDPIAIAMHDANAPPDAGRERSDFTLSWKADAAEGARQGELVMVDEGLLDDSVAGQWTRLRLRRLEDGSWRLTAHHVAWRCSRGPGRGMSTYHREICP